MTRKFLYLSFFILPLLGCLSQKVSVSEVQKSQFVSNDRLREIRDNCELPLGLIQLLDFDRVDSYYKDGFIGVNFWIKDKSCLTSHIVDKPMYLSDSLFVPTCYIDSDLEPILKAIAILKGVEKLEYPSIASVHRMVLAFQADGFTGQKSLDGITLKVKRGVIWHGGRFYTPSEH